MVLSNPKLRVGLVTTHIPHAKVHKSISVDKIVKEFFCKWIKTKLRYLSSKNLCSKLESSFWRARFNW